MRLSVHKNDLGYDPAIVTQRVRVLLNGREIDRCTTADEEAGRVYRYHSPPIVRGDCLAEYMQAGSVKIILPGCTS